jgi:hypothetical protein
MYLTCYAEYGLCLVVCLSISPTDPKPNKVTNQKKKKKKKGEEEKKKKFLCCLSYRMASHDITIFVAKYKLAYFCNCNTMR